MRNTCHRLLDTTTDSTIKMGKVVTPLFTGVTPLPPLKPLRHENRVLTYLQAAAETPGLPNPPATEWQTEGEKAQGLAASAG